MTRGDAGPGAGPSAFHDPLWAVGSSPLPGGPSSIPCPYGRPSTHMDPRNLLDTYWGRSTSGLIILYSTDCDRKKNTTWTVENKSLGHTASATKGEREGSNR
jgi:hypothetical protein